MGRLATASTAGTAACAPAVPAGSQRCRPICSVTGHTLEVAKERQPYWIPLGFGDGLVDRSQFLMLCGAPATVPCPLDAALSALQRRLPLARSFQFPNFNGNYKHTQTVDADIALARFDSHEDCARSLSELTAAADTGHKPLPILARFAAMPDVAAVGPLLLPAHNCYKWCLMPNPVGLHSVAAAAATFTARVHPNCPPEAARLLAIAYLRPQTVHKNGHSSSLEEL